METFNILILISITPLIGVILLVLIPDRYNLYCCNIAFFTSCLTFFLSLIMWLNFDSGCNAFNFYIQWIGYLYLIFITL